EDVTPSPRNLRRQTRHMRVWRRRNGWRETSGPFGELVEVGLALLEVGALALLRFLTHVVEERGVAGELLDAGETVVGRVARRLDHAQRERAVLQHLPAPRDRLLLERFERHDRVHQPHVERFLRVVLATEE